MSKSRAPINEIEQARRGKVIAEALGLKASPEHPDRYDTQWGGKTCLGLFRMIKRIIDEGDV